MADKELTVREILEEQVGLQGEASGTQTAPENVSRETTSATDNETAEQKTERLRDEAGRFAAKDKTANTASATAAAPTNVPSQEGAAAVAAEPELKPIQRPSSWKKELWPLWDKMATGAALSPQEARQIAEYNAQREQQFASGVSTYKQEAERAKPIMDAIAPFQGELQRINTSAPQMVHQLMSAHNTLANGSPQEKLQLFSNLMQNYGVPINAFFDQAAQQQYLQSAPIRQMQPVQQPNVEELVAQALQKHQAVQTVSQMERDTQKYPFLQYVRQSMAQILESGETADLDDAYQRALELPEHSLLTSALQQQQQVVDEQQRLAATKKVAQVARANVVSPKSATPMTVASNGKTSVRDALVEAMQTHRGSARV